MKSKYWLYGVLTLAIILVVLISGCAEQGTISFSYQKVNVQGFSIEIIDNMEKFIERTERLPNSYVIVYAHPVEGAYDSFVGIGWDTKGLADAAKINTVLDYLDTNVKGFKKTWGGSDYAQVDGGVLTINGHSAKFITYTYVTQKGLASKVKLIAWFCESSQRYYNMLFTSPEQVWDKYASAYEHAEMTMNCHEETTATIKDANICEKITNSDGKDECYFTLALETKDIGLCKKVIEDVPNKMCHAVVTNNVDKCEEITDSADKDSCYATFATQTKNSDACEKIANNNIKDQCYDIVAK